ncbi:actin-like ATPase domain-containing protein [Punctularia strigosozonata HHB-11173 SS5]|uniref:Actin-like ATPase domain-containing protein n=1 Tax=Punctularia strigosozonata (strain HHB-11173) TaxID=741275 RepID=R7S2K1_PUNST|nr:actin-like ATPase domain-containing protein [Punctularia strigosozonata HHB-11173 SS5]EIN03476.1 actin-like ATPase domain-containing protein [Punctularia strigosozonata HHB-11173 SS5]
MTSTPNGTADAPIDVNGLPTVVGINFGNSYASIAENLAECIANEDGERQIACAIAFQGDEVYIGNGAKQQLVKNAHNTITGFRNLLGKKFSELPHDKPTVSAPVIQHPDHADLPAFKVSVGADAPTDRILTVAEATTLFLKSLLGSATAFLGKPVDGAVLSVPAWFDEHQRLALQHAAEAAGVKVLQLLDEAGAAVAASTASSASSLPADRTQLIVDLGASALELTLVSLRAGLAHVLARASDPAVGGDKIDDALVKFFAKDFTKKTKTPLAVCPAADTHDQRAEAKLRLALEHTKRTVSASAGAATCAVESLKHGLDYTGSLNRMRFDMEARAVYAHVARAAARLVTDQAGLDPFAVDEVVYAGGSASLPGLDEALVAAFGDALVTPFTAGTVVGGGAGDPTTLLARGCALQAQLLVHLGDADEDEEVRWAFDTNSKWTEVSATGAAVGVLFPEEKGAAADAALGGLWVTGVKAETAVPCRRAVRFDVDLGGGEAKKVGFEVWEAKEDVKVELVKPPKIEYDEGDEVPEDEEEEEPEEEVKERIVTKQHLLGAVAFEAKLAAKDKGRWRTRLEVQFIVGADGAVEVDAWEVSDTAKGEPHSLKIAAP